MKSKLFVIPILAVMIISLAHNTAWVHPHVFMVQRIGFLFDEKGLAGFKMQWKFDEMFSSMITEDYDKNKNNHLEENEVAEIKKNAFSYLSNYNYFSFVKIDKKPFEVKYVKKFSARIEKNKLMYEFIIPCHVSAARQKKHISIATYDPSYYSAIFFAKYDSVSLENAGAFHVTTAVREDKETTIYYGMVNPWAAFIDFRKK